jgi:hypothetical protein
VDGEEQVADPMVAYLERPGTVQQIAHPDGGDHCTVIVPPSEGLDDLPGPPDRLSHQLVVPADLDVRHRALLTRSRRGAEAFELLERTTVLARQLLVGFADAMLFGAPSSALIACLADAVREILDACPDRGLHELAQDVHVPPYHLSRSLGSSPLHAVEFSEDRIRWQGS